MFKLSRELRESHNVLSLPSRKRHWIELLAPSIALWWTRCSLTGPWRGGRRTPGDTPGWQSWTWRLPECIHPGWRPRRWWQDSCPPAPGRASCSVEHSAGWSARQWTGSQWRRLGAPLDGTPGPHPPWAQFQTQYWPHLVEHLGRKQYQL